jgi:predicted DNA-binding transcriptional regulator AlpA
MDVNMNIKQIRSDKLFLRQRDLLSNYLPFSSTTLWRKVKQGTFPSPVKLSPGITVWRLSDVNEWLASKGKPL